VNYISHFLLTQLLLPTLLSTVSASAPGTVRIINVSSDGHAKLAPKQGIVFDDINLKPASTWTRYGQSKLANVLHAKELARRYGTQGLWAASLHPGTVKTFVAPSP
jgi:NAD(P)-dependent dehydrogenase (short-subunit alcohol dehydrogenase family)